MPHASVRKPRPVTKGGRLICGSGAMPSTTITMPNTPTVYITAFFLRLAINDITLSQHLRLELERMNARAGSFLVAHNTKPCNLIKI